MKLSHCAVAAASAAHSLGSAPCGSIGSVSHRLALLTTARAALTTPPPRSRTPAARPPSTSTDSTWHPVRSFPPCFSSPWTRASTSAPLPPAGYSSVEAGENQSANMKAISADSVPDAVAPDSRKQSRSIHRSTNGSEIPPAARTSE